MMILQIDNITVLIPAIQLIFWHPDGSATIELASGRQIDIAPHQAELLLKKLCDDRTMQSVRAQVAAYYVSLEEEADQMTDESEEEVWQ